MGGRSALALGIPEMNYVRESVAESIGQIFIGLPVGEW